MAIGLQVERAILTPHCRDLKSPTDNLLHTNRNKLFATGNQFDFLGRKRLSSFPLITGAMNGDVTQRGEPEGHRRSPQIQRDQPTNCVPLPIAVSLPIFLPGEGGL